MIGAWTCVTITIMYSVLLTGLSSLSGEAASSIGKYENKKHRESVYTIAFLSIFSGIIFFTVSISFFGAKFVFVSASIPFVALRVALEILNSYVCAKALVKTERSSLSFLSLIAIPLLLGLDILLKYTISVWQIAGVLLLFMSLVFLYRKSKRSRKGVRWAFYSSLTSVAATAAFKYDITHFNSVAAEQLIVMSAMALIFYVIAIGMVHENPLGKLLNPYMCLQSGTQGLGISIISFAYIFAPASVVLAMSRAFSLLWSIVFGRVYFHEQKLYERLKAFSIAVLAIVCLTIKP